MEKLTSKDFLYLDYNATSPLTDSVIEFLSKGDFLFPNPSSMHSPGRRADRFIRQTTDYLHELWGLKEVDFDLFYHSGATEGMASLIKGFALNCLMNGQKIDFFYGAADHSAVTELIPELEFHGHRTHRIDVDLDGQFDLDKLIGNIKKSKGPVLLNYTWVNNETGVVWPISLARKIKEETEATVVVDAVQSVGKIPDWSAADSSLDAYTFSGHKFGALKGVGFSFISNNYRFRPCIVGGGQQRGLRGGTGNALGIYSLKLALDDIYSRYDYDINKKALDSLKDRILELGDDLALVAPGAPHRSSNTISVIFSKKRADVMMAAFDMAKIAVSSGSACSSGAVGSSRILKAMGYEDIEAKSGIRFSISPFINLSEVEKIESKICSVFKKFV